MSLKMISMICAAEEEALIAKLRAELQAKEDLEEAHTAGKSDVAKTLARADAEITHLIRVSDQKATEEAKELASSTANRLATLRARAERRLDDAAQYIFERICRE